jgi:hypothetical protein
MLLTEVKEDIKLSQYQITQLPHGPPHGGQKGFRSPPHQLPATTDFTMDSSQSEYVTLVSCDGFEFILPRSTACVSGTIRRMLHPSST